MEETKSLELEMWGLVSSTVENDEDIRSENEENYRDGIGHEYGGGD